MYIIRANMSQVLVLVKGSNQKPFPIYFVLNLPSTLATILLHTEMTAETDLCQP